MCTWRDGSDLAGDRGRGCSISVEVSPDLHIEESREGGVFRDSTDKHVKQLELGSGGIWSIHCSAKNTPVHLLPHLLMSCLSPLKRVHPQCP